MLILGTGLGLVMQILITAVQNAVQHEDLGAATAGANFFRSIGGSFGTAVFGALYVNALQMCIRDRPRGRRDADCAGSRVAATRDPRRGDGI